MALNYQENGMLVPGIHIVSWDEFVLEYGYNPHRTNLIIGLKMALTHLKSVGCKRLYVDGSFITKKSDPGDYDACWEHLGVDLQTLKTKYPLFFDFDNACAKQKAYYKGEFYPARFKEAKKLVSFLDFFQQDKEDNKKGIICLNL